MSPKEYTFVVPKAEYQEYWDENYEYEMDENEDDDDDCLVLFVNYFNSPDDKAWEYSIKWEEECDQVQGEKTGINTSSIFALLSTKWEVIDDSDDDE